jgi:hypothetical protein
MSKGLRCFSDEVKGKSCSAGEGSGTLKEKADAWRSSKFNPACRRIERAGLCDRFSGMTAPDIYVMILHFFREFDGGFPRGEDFDEFLSEYVFAGRRGRRARIHRRPHDGADF